MTSSHCNHDDFNEFGSSLSLTPSRACHSHNLPQTIMEQQNATLIDHNQSFKPSLTDTNVQDE
eukprot:4924645-Amphidinium_carterae.1